MAVSQLRKKEGITNFTIQRKHFWRILAAFDNDYQLLHFNGKEAVIERKQIMEDLEIGVQNMGKTRLAEQG